LQATVAIAGKRIPIDGDQNEVIYSWGVKSEHRAVQYEIILRRNGETSCDCPGWVFKRKDQERGCKHINAMLAPEIDTIRRLFMQSKPLPMNAVAPVSDKQRKTNVYAEEPAVAGVSMRLRRVITVE